MATTAASLKARLMTSLGGLDFIATEGDELGDFCEALATAIVDELHLAVDVSPAGVPPLSNSGGPVAGLGKLL